MSKHTALHLSRQFWRRSLSVLGSRRVDGFKVRHISRMERPVYMEWARRGEVEGRMLVVTYVLCR